MKIANKYNHLNAEEYLIVNRRSQLKEIQDCIAGVDANKYTKISCDKASIGKVLYAQAGINKEIKDSLKITGWDERKINYYVTTDEDINRKIIPILDSEEQKKIIENAGFKALNTFNQVDFQKDEIAIEVQFGKYPYVAYDLHVKHTFFYSRNDINVGIEIIPTKAMCECMDTGVSWFENEVTNVLREGRTNPPVPILMLGIEPDEIIKTSPLDYTDSEYAALLKKATNVDKLKNQINKMSKEPMGQSLMDRVEKIQRCIDLIQKEELCN